MQSLLEACFFHREELPHPRNDAGVECVDLKLLSEHVARSRAQLHSVDDGLVSVSVREQCQKDVRGLMCGARTLVIDASTGAVIVRGVNKFFDYADLVSERHDDDTHEGSKQPSCASSGHPCAAAVWDSRFTCCPMWVQRKMAGFVVTLFSLDGRTLRVMSKHVWAGPHVVMARTILSQTLSASQESALAADLHRMQLSVSCECIAEPAQDYAHPIPESAAFHRSLVVFAVQFTHRVMECALAFEHVVTLAAQWGLPCVPHARLPPCAHGTRQSGIEAAETSATQPNTTEHATLHDPSIVHDGKACHAANGHPSLRSAAVQALVDLAQQWQARYEPFAPWQCATLAEGFVLVLELPLHVRHDHTDDTHDLTGSNCNDDDEDSIVKDTLLGVCYRMCRPVRVKVKTTGYVALRSLRALLTAPPASASQMPFLLYHHAVLVWAQTRCCESFAQALAWLRGCVEQEGVFALHRRFVGDMVNDETNTEGCDARGVVCRHERRRWRCDGDDDDDDDEGGMFVRDGRFCDT